MEAEEPDIPLPQNLESLFSEIERLQRHEMAEHDEVFQEKSEPASSGSEIERIQRRNLESRKLDSPPGDLERLISELELLQTQESGPMGAVPPLTTEPESKASESARLQRLNMERQDPDDPLPSLEIFLSKTDKFYSQETTQRDNVPPSPKNPESQTSKTERIIMATDEPPPKELAQAFAPCWRGCSGVFNEGNAASSAENERIHHYKHAVVGREWGREVPISEYRERATKHLNCLEPETIIELCQVEDLAVVKYNLDSGEVGIVRRDDGLIKTFFRPNDVNYVLRKVDSGLWGEPALADGFELSVQASDFADDPQNFYLFGRLEELAMELPNQACEMVTAFAESAPSLRDLMLLLARLGECRFIIFEFQRRILTEAQSDAVFALRKKIVGAVASFGGLERYRSQELTETVKTSLEAEVKKQEDWWTKATVLVTDLDEFESSLFEREMIGYAMLELKVLHLHRRMLGIDLILFESRLHKSDINIRNVFYQLATRFNHRENRRVSPEGFFWRLMAENLS